MKKLKIILAVIAAAAFAVFAAGCTAENVYDVDEKIMANANNTMYRNSSKNKIGNSLSVKADYFMGVDTVYTYNVKDGEISITYSLTVSEGRFKIVLTDGETIIIVGDETIEETTKTFEVENGKYRVRIVGEDAKFSLNIKF